MVRQLSKEQLVKLARYIISSWEAIPLRAQLLSDSQTDQLDPLRQLLEADLRERMGGEEVYEAAKQVVIDYG